LFLRMPPIDGVGRCRLQRWCVSEGASFARGDVLAEIDSDLAVIEYKAQTGGVLALRRAKEGDKIVDGQILGVQVLDVHDVPGAAAWLAHVERLARREAAELQKLEAQEEAESDVVDDIERKQGSGGDMEGASAGSKHHHHRNTDSS
jgi:pyruvate/2-oxoglutarate dehydrogenase complex dihydrolipoamide acyltransferase (E2) component